MYAYIKFVFFRFRRTEKMDSVMKELRGPMPPRIFGLEPPLHLRLYCARWGLAYRTNTVGSERVTCAHDNNYKKTLANLVFQFHCRRMKRYRAADSGISVCLDTSTERCLICSQLPDSSLCQQNGIFSTLMKTC